MATILVQALGFATSWVLPRFLVSSISLDIFSAVFSLVLSPLGYLHAFPSWSFLCYLMRPSCLMLMLLLASVLALAITSLLTKGCERFCFRSSPMLPDLFAPNLIKATPLPWFFLFLFIPSRLSCCFLFRLEGRFCRVLCLSGSPMRKT